MKTIETRRLILRDFTLDDLVAFNHYATNPDVGPNAGWKPHENLEESQKILEMFIREQEVWAIENKETKELMGSIGLHHDGTRALPTCRSIGYVLSKDFWGHGFATEATQAILNYAFEDAGLTLVTISHYPYNKRSERVIEKCGFHYEGTLRGASKLYDQTIVDSCSYSMTKDEYCKLKK
jgi:putative acetyltransferase